MNTQFLKLKKYILLLALAMPFISTPSLADPPDTSGPYVVRFEDIGWFFYVDNGLVAIHGADFAGTCLYGEEAFYTDLWQIQAIDNPADLDLWVGLVKGDDIATWIYPWSFFVFDQFGELDWPATCPSILTFGPIASGTADIVRTDNDVFTDARLKRQRYNAHKLSAHGMLESQSGDRVVFSGGFNCVWNGNLADPWERCKNRISLND